MRGGPCPGVIAKWKQTILEHGQEGPLAVRAAGTDPAQSQIPDRYQGFGHDPRDTECPRKWARGGPPHSQSHDQSQGFDISKDTQTVLDNGTEVAPHTQSHKDRQGHCHYQN